MTIIMKKIVIIDQFVFDANVNTKQQIENLVQARFDIMTKPGTLKFSYDKTTKGYKYIIKRYLPYAYNGFILDNDCTFLTDIPICDFQVDLLNHNHKPMLYAIPGKHTDGYYVPIKIFEDFYKDMLEAATNAEIPTKVKVFAHDTMVGVDVDY